MSIISKTIQEKRDLPFTKTVYTSGRGVIGSAGALMTKAGNIFLPSTEADIKILEYFVSIGIVTKTEEA
jgi:hypothetical protein